MCAEPELRNELSAIRMAAKNITEGHESTERGVRKESIFKGECE